MQYHVLISGSYESTPITPERAQRLEDIGFVWETGDPRSVPWDVQFKELLAYKEKNGHVLVPVRYEAKTKLGIWVTTQRRERKRFLAGQKSKILTAERIRQLDEIGFVWKGKRGGGSGRPRKHPKTEAEESPNPAKSTHSKKRHKRRLSTSDRSKAKKKEPARKTKKKQSSPQMSDDTPQMSDTSRDSNLEKPSAELDDKPPTPAELDDKNEPSRASLLEAAFPVEQQQQPLVDETTALLLGVVVPFQQSPPRALDRISTASSPRREGLVPLTTPLMESQFHNSDHHTRMRILRAEEESQTRLNRRLQMRRRQALLLGGGASSSFPLRHAGGLSSLFLNGGPSGGPCGEELRIGAVSSVLPFRHGGSSLLYGGPSGSGRCEQDALQQIGGVEGRIMQQHHPDNGNAGIGQRGLGTSCLNNNFNGDCSGMIEL
mmetsp:Transcript_12937/g.19085  ORF Transcript_12937/g.19085 Transcript_12937/m.19085 type:complete len:432 (-) Transcript_12937:412-1707(-)